MSGPRRGITFDTGVHSVVGPNKAAQGPRQSKPDGADEAFQCVVDARENTTEWENCIGDYVLAGAANENEAARIADSIQTEAEDFCEEDALRACREGQPIPNAAPLPRKTGKGTARRGKKKKQANRQTEQGYLLQNMGTLSLGIEHETYVQQVVDPSKPRFPNLILLTGVEGNLVNVMSTSRRLTPLLNALPLDISGLMPSVRVYKRHLKDGGDISTGRLWRTGDLEEFRFADKIEIGDVLDPNSAGSGVGLKSFEWYTTGTDAFTAPRTLRATLKLHFQTISDLLGAAGPGAAGVRWTDLIIQRGGNIDIDPCARGIVAQDTVSEEDQIEEQKTGNLPPTMRDFSIVVEVGYQYPSGNLLSEGIKRAVDSSRIQLALTLTDHKFSFKENGAIDLEINYGARYENVMDTYATDIFNLTAKGANVVAEKIEEIERQIKGMEEDISGSGSASLACQLQTSTNTTEQTEIQEKMKEKRERISTLKEQIDKLKRDLRVSNYGRFVEHLLDADTPASLYTMDVTDDQWAKGELPETIVGVSNVADVADSASRAVYTALLNSNDGEIDTSMFPDLNGASPVFNKKPLLRGYRRVQYFFLGDLINFMAYALPYNSPKDQGNANAEKFEIVLGDLEFIDWKYFKEEVEKVGGWGSASEEERDFLLRTLQTNKNLAFLPISLDFYSQWFSKNVVNGNTIWTFANYLNKVLVELVMGSLTARLSDERGEAARRMTNEQNHIRRGILVGTNSTGYLTRGKIKYQPAGDPDEENPIWVNPVQSQAGEPMTQYLVLGCSRLPIGATVVDPAKNRLQGIYHLYIGVNSGIVKAIDFARTNKAPIQDMMIMRAAREGDTSIGHILQPYNATVRTFGSPHWIPGQYVYLNPATLGRGNWIERLKLSRKLGLGGFYLINKVSSVVEAGKLETTLDCIHQYYGNLPDDVTAGTTQDAPPDGVDNEDDISSPYGFA